MNIVFRVIFATCLQFNSFMIANPNIINNTDVNSDKYFIFVNKDHNHKIEDQLDEEQYGKYFLISDKNLESVQRRFRDLKKDREERKQAELLKTQQQRKIKELTEFMKDHQMTTNFLYDEMQRIKRQRMVKDDLRRMIEYLGKPGKENIRSKILKCYQEAKKTEVLSRDTWGLETNNLVINVLKDPYNYGYLN